MTSVKNVQSSLNKAKEAEKAQSQVNNNRDYDKFQEEYVKQLYEAKRRAENLLRLINIQIECEQSI